MGFCSISLAGSRLSDRFVSLDVPVWGCYERSFVRGVHQTQRSLSELSYFTH